MRHNKGGVLRFLGGIDQPYLGGSLAFGSLPQNIYMKEMMSNESTY